MDKSLIKVVNIILVILMIFSGLSTGLYVYYHFIVKPNHITTGTNYFTDQSPTDILEIDNISEDKIDSYKNRTLFELNYYDNTQNNGIELCEFKLNYFMDSTMTTSTCRSVGFQVHFDVSQWLFSNWGDSSQIISAVNYLNSKDTSVLCYTFYDDLNWQSFDYNYNTTNSALNSSDKFIVKIDETPYLIELNGYKEYTVDKTFLGIKTGEETKQYKLTWFDLFSEIAYSVKTNSKGYSEGYMLLNVSDYFKSVKQFNPDTGKFDKLPDVDIVNNYAYVKFNYSDKGVTNANQSLFGLIDGDCNYGKTNSDIQIQDYWNVKLNYTIDENTKIDNTNIFELKHIDSYNGDFVDLSLQMKSILNSIPDNNLNIVIDIDKINTKYGVNCKGLYISAFQDLKINSLKIIGSGEFNVLTKSLINSDIKTIYKSKDIYLNISDSAINNEYEVVEL